jgi:magnesium transporter
MSATKNEQDKVFEDKYKENWDLVQDALAKEELEAFREHYLDLHPYDQMMFFIDQPAELRHHIYSYLSPEEFAEVMINIELKDTKTYFIEMDPRFASMVLAEMPADDAVDILNEMTAEEVASFLSLMDDQSANEIKKLLHYEEKTAGSIMTTEYVHLYEKQTVKEAMRSLRKQAPDAETIYYLYVLNQEKQLVGVLSLRELIVAEGDLLLDEVMSENIVYVSVAKDQEEVAQMIMDYDFLALPVVDFKNHLLGIITVDDILDVVDEEAREDYSKLAAMSDTDVPDDTILDSAKKRLPWLIILLFLGMLTANLIGYFENTLEQVAMLAVFIPLIAGMAGNSGTQALAVAVRGIATGTFGNQGRFKMIAREAGTGLITGTVCGVIITFVVYLWQGDLYLGMLVGVSILVSLFVATLAGTLVPMFMEKLNIDPAVASGPFITTINDIISILIYFGMATTFMGYLI